MSSLQLCEMVLRFGPSPDASVVAVVPSMRRVVGVRVLMPARPLLPH
jgi:hypothetical protein